MNVLPKEKQAQITNALVEGCSVRATARLVGSDANFERSGFLLTRLTCQSTI